MVIVEDCSYFFSLAHTKDIDFSSHMLGKERACGFSIYPIPGQKLRR